MQSFEDFNLKKQLRNAISDLGFEQPTEIQKGSFSVVLSGKDLLGIAQTGTGKTIAYGLPILEEMKFSKQLNPRVLILVPTRELVKQVEEEFNSLAKYLSLRIETVYGGANINTQRQRLAYGCDILIATPGRLYDLVLSQSVSLKDIKKLVIDEVDVMLDLGFRPQILSIFELLPTKRQNLMFSATMTDEVEELINEFFVSPEKVSIAVSGTPLENIEQQAYSVPNFYTKINLLKHLIKDKGLFGKVLVFASSKRMVNRIFEELLEDYSSELGVIHSNKSQNNRFKSIEEFDAGNYRILVATDIISRGLDLDKLSHVINFDTPKFPENYMHRIGRTGRATEQGNSILFYTEEEEEAKIAIEELMNFKIPLTEIPEDVVIAHKLLPEEQPIVPGSENENRLLKRMITGASTHQKKAKNSKVNLGGSYKREIAKKYKKPKTRGDKNFGKRKGMK